MNLKKLMFLILNMIPAFCILFTGCSFSKNKMEIISSRDVKQRIVMPSVESFETTLVKNTISFDELKSDLNDIVFILETAYAGYDDAVLKGFDTNDFKLDVENHFKKQTIIATDDFASYVSKYLSVYIRDSHFAIFSKNNRSYRPSSFSKVFMSSVFVKNVNEKFIVVESGEKSLKVDSLYTGAKENLFYYPSKGNEVYRIGSLESCNEKSLNKNFNFDGKDVLLELNYLDGSVYGQDIKNYTEYETKKGVYIYLPSLAEASVNDEDKDLIDSIFEKFSNAGKKYNNKDYIIIDFRTNGGGNDTYYFNFLKGLLNDKSINKYLEKYLSCEYVASPLVEKSVLKFKELYGIKTWNVVDITSKLVKENPGKVIKWKEVREYFDGEVKPSFDGKIIFLMGKHTVSSAEDSLFLTKKVFEEDCILVGENSGGYLNFGNMFTYVLPNSKLGLYAGMTKFIYDLDKVEDGTGFMPDVWSSNCDMANTIDVVTSDKEMVSFFNNEINNLIYDYSYYDD